MITRCGATTLSVSTLTGGMPLKRLFLLPLICSLASAAPLTLQDSVTFAGHPNGTFWATLTPDGQTVYTQGSATLIEWDAQNGQPRRTFSPLAGKEFKPVSLNFHETPSSDSVRLLITEDRQGNSPRWRIHLLNLQTGKIEATVDMWNGPYGVQWGKGQLALSFTDGTGGTLWYWTEEMSQPRSIPSASGGNFTHLAFSPDHGILYVLNTDLEAYDTHSGEQLWSLPATELVGRNGQSFVAWTPESSAVILSSSPYADRLLIRNSDGLALLDPSTHTLLGYLDARFNRLDGVAWSRDGVMLNTDGYLHVIDANTGKTLGIVDGLFVSSPDADTVWTQYYTEFIRFSIASGLDLETMHSNIDWNSPVATDPQGRPVRWLTRDVDGGYNIATPQSKVPIIDHFTRVARYSPDGQRIASLGNQELWLLDAKTHEKLLSVRVDNALDFAFSPDGRWLAVGGYPAQLLDAHSGKLVKSLQPSDEQKKYNVQKWKPGPRGLNRSLAFSPDGKMLAVGYEASTIGLWDITSGTLTQTLRGGRGWVLSLAYSPDGRALVSGWGDGSLHFYDALTGQETAVREVNQGFVRWLAFSPDGQQVAAASGDGSVSLWTARGQLLRRLTGHSGAATSVTYLDAQTLVSGDSAGTLRVWNTADGKLLQQVQGNAALVQSLVTSPSGTQLLSSGRDNVLRVYGR